MVLISVAANPKSCAFLDYSTGLTYRPFSSVRCGRDSTNALCRFRH
jgi:hypothetical protein